MAPERERFLDRRDAGRQLAAELKARSIPHPVVLALPRGGVPVGYEIARALHAPLDIFLVRKLGAPGYKEFGIGAVVDGDHPQTVLNSEAIQLLQVPPDYVAQEREQQLQEIERRRRLYRGSDPPVDINDRTPILVDDGVATGGTMLVAVRALRQATPHPIVIAVPVAAPDALEKLVHEADDVVCLAAPPVFRAVGQHYADFRQLRDDEVIELLSKRRSEFFAERTHPE